MSTGVGVRLLLAHLLLSIIVLGSVEFVLGPRLQNELLHQLDQRLQVAATAVVDFLAEGEPARSAADRTAATTGFRVSVVGADGYLEADSALAPGELRDAGLHAGRPEVLAALQAQRGSAERQSTTTGISTRYLAVAVGDGRVARVAADLASIEASMDEVHRSVSLAAGIGLLVAGLLGGAAAMIVGRSVRELTVAARRISYGKPGPISIPRGPGELGEIAGILERMASRLAEQFGRLTAERDLLGGVLDAMTEAVLVLRTDGSVLRANPTAVQLLGLRDLSQEQPLIESVRFPPLLDAVRAASGGEVAPLELQLEGPPRRELVGSAAPLPEGSEAAVVVVLRDVTELRRLEAVRRDFVASASHELRTPVATIRGYAESLAAGALDDRATAERFVAGLGRQAERLTELIDDLLDLSRVESGGMRLEPRPLEVRQALGPVLESARERAASKDLDLQVEAPPASLRLLADPRAVDMAFGNLVDNAIKYTPAGGTVRVSVEAGPKEIRLVVEDTGPGIEAAHLGRIFERFYRVDAGRARGVGGTGLGLAIARHVALQSGGDVGATSTPGRGSRFWVRFPAAR